jgi:hypothetical protein
MHVTYGEPFIRSEATALTPRQSLKETDEETDTARAEFKTV